MPARIYRLLADELDISEDRAQKLLRAMMREVQKRSRRGGGIRIPDLGSFVVQDGELTFSPSDSLARAVNQEYEGLAEEDLSTADPEPASEEENQGPTTITTGFHRSVTPDRASSGSTDGADADTDEFQVPSDPDGADTAEFEAPAEDEPSPPADEEPATASTEDPSAGASDEIQSESSHGGGSSNIDIPSFQPSDPSPPSEPDASEPDASEASSEDSFSESTASESTAPETASSETPSSETASSEPASSEAASSPASSGAESAGTDAEAPEGEEARREDPPSGSSSLYEFASQVPGADDPPSEESADGPASAKEDSSEAAPSSPAADDNDDDYDESGQIWKSDDPWDFSDASEADESDAASASAEEPETAGEQSEEAGSLSRDDEAADFASPESAFAEEGFEMSSSEASASTEAGGPDGPQDAQPAEPDPSSEPERSSSASRILVTAVVLLFLGAAGWFVAGQQGLVPAPTAVIGGGGAPASGTAAETASPEGASAQQTTDPAATQTTDGSASDASAAQTAASGSGAGATDDAGSRGFRPGGGWTISVASRTDRTAAQSLVERYREQVGDDLPVDVVEATVNGEPRYRVGVGQFSSRSAARDAMQTYGDTIPSGAWPIQIP